MQLQKRLSRAYKGKDYPKWIVTIPPKLIKLLGWKEGQELEANIELGRLILNKKVSERTGKR
jgi:bifunctional DNA-binding transcriptional regulator/antitoxin component of YhaV-PrlF toxin-antitoxin module